METNIKEAIMHQCTNTEDPLNKATEQLDLILDSINSQSNLLPKDTLKILLTAVKSEINNAITCNNITKQLCQIED